MKKPWTAALAILLAAALCGCANAVYDQYRGVNENYFGKKVFSQITYVCSDAERTYVAEVMDTAKKVFTYTGREADSDKNVGALSRYYRYSEDSEAASVKCDLKLVTTKHDDKSGYIWVVYSRGGIKKDGSIDYGSSEILARWNITKKDGQWSVTDTDEAP